MQCVHVQYCRNCETHNWCTHHDATRYHRVFIKFAELMAAKLPHIQVIGNMIPPHLTPITLAQNKYVDTRTRKYVIYPTIGAFQITIDGACIFSKKQTNSWPDIPALVNHISNTLQHDKIQDNPQQHKLKAKHKSPKKLPQIPTMTQGHTPNKWIKSDQDNQDDKSKFTLTDHFKRYKDNHIDHHKLSSTETAFHKKQTNGFRKEGKEIIFKLDSIEEESPFVQEKLPEINIQRKKSKMKEFDTELRHFENKFKSIEERVSSIQKHSINQKQTVSRINNLHLETNRKFNQEKINQSRYSPRNNSIEEYIHGTEKYKLNKLHEIYGEWKLLPKKQQKNGFQVKKKINSSSSDEQIKNNTTYQEKKMNKKLNSTQVLFHSKIQTKNSSPPNIKINSFPALATNNALTNKPCLKDNKKQIFINLNRESVDSELLNNQNEKLMGETHFSSYTRKNGSIRKNIIKQYSTKQQESEEDQTNLYIENKIPLNKKSISLQKSPINRNNNGLKSTQRKGIVNEKKLCEYQNSQNKDNFLSQEQDEQYYKKETNDNSMSIKTKLKTDGSKKNQTLQQARKSLKSRRSLFRNSNRSQISSNRQDSRQVLDRTSESQQDQFSSECEQASTKGKRNTIVLKKNSFKKQQQQDNAFTTSRKKSQKSKLGRDSMRRSFQIKKDQEQQGQLKEKTIIKSKQEIREIKNNLQNTRKINHQKNSFKSNSNQQKKQKIAQSKQIDQKQPKSTLSQTQKFIQLQKKLDILQKKCHHSQKIQQVQQLNKQKFNSSKKSFYDKNNFQKQQIQKFHNLQNKKEKDHSNNDQVALQQQSQEAQNKSKIQTKQYQQKRLQKNQNVKKNCRKNNQNNKNNDIGQKQKKQDFNSCQTINNKQQIEEKKNQNQIKSNNDQELFIKKNCINKQYKKIIQNSQNPKSNNQKIQESRILDIRNSKQEKQNNKFINKNNNQNQSEITSEQQYPKNIKQNKSQITSERQQSINSQISEENLNEQLEKEQAQQEILLPTKQFQDKNKIHKKEHQKLSKEDIVSKEKNQLRQIAQKDLNDQEKDYNHKTALLENNLQNIAPKNHITKTNSKERMINQQNKDQLQHQKDEITEGEEVNIPNVFSKNHTTKTDFKKKMINHQKHDQFQHQKDQIKEGEEANTIISESNKQKFILSKQQNKLIDNISSIPFQQQIFKNDTFFDQVAKKQRKQKQSQQKQININTKTIISKQISYDQEKLENYQHMKTEEQIDNQLNLNQNMIMKQSLNENNISSNQIPLKKQQFRQTSRKKNIKKQTLELIKHNQSQNFYFNNDKRKSIKQTLDIPIDKSLQIQSPRIQLSNIKITKHQQQKKNIQNANQTDINQRHQFKDKASKKEISIEKEQQNKQQNINKSIKKKIDQNSLIAMKQQNSQRFGSSPDNIQKSKSDLSNKKSQFIQEQHRKKSKKNTDSFKQNQSVKETSQQKNRKQKDRINSPVNIKNQKNYTFNSSLQKKQFSTIGVQKDLTYEMSIQTDLNGSDLLPFFHEKSTNQNYSKNDKIDKISQRTKNIFEAIHQKPNLIQSSNGRELFTEDRCLNNNETSRMFKKTPQKNEQKFTRKNKPSPKDYVFNEDNRQKRALIVDYIYNQNAQVMKFQRLNQMTQEQILNQLTQIRQKNNNFILASKLYNQEGLMFDNSLSVENIVVKNKSLNNFLKILTILCNRNEMLIWRLFEKGKQNRHVLIGDIIGIWLNINSRWQCVLLDDELETDQKKQPTHIIHTKNQLWVNFLLKALMKKDQKLFERSCAFLFTMLTGCNAVTFSIKSQLSRNQKWIHQLKENRGFIIHAKKASDNGIYYLLSAKDVNENQQKQTLIQIKNSQHQNVWMRLSQFILEFTQIQILHLHPHYYYTSQSFICRKGQLVVFTLSFENEVAGTVTLSYSNQQCGILRSFLYKQSYNGAMKLIGKVKQENKYKLFFDCGFNAAKYTLFVQSQGEAWISFAGEGKPKIRLIQTIKEDGMKNDKAQYMPISRVKEKALPQEIKRKEDFSKLKQNFVDYLINSRQSN